MKTRSIWLYSLFVAVVYIAVYGYLFNTGDQAEHLPQVYKMQNPNLFKNDFFVQEYMRGFTIRDYYVFIVSLLSAIAPVAWVCFVLHVFSVTFSAFGIFRITQKLSNNKLAPFITPLLALIVFYSFTVGGNAVHEVQFISSSLAWPLATWAFYKLLSGQYTAAGAFAGFATLAQPLIGLQAFMLIFAIIILQNKHIRFGTIVYSFLMYCLTAALVLFPLFLRQFFTPFKGDNELYLKLLYEFRNYNHYLPHLFPATDFAKFGFILLVGVGLLFKSTLNQKATLKQLFFLIFAGLVVYTLAMETHILYGIGKLQWYKTTVWIAVFSSIIIGIQLSVWLEKKLYKPTLFKYYRIGFTVLGGGLLFLILNSALLTGLGEKYMVGNYTKSDLTLMHEWIEKNTDINAVILTSPVDEGFACQAKRAQPVCFKAIIHEPVYMLKWYALVTEVYGVTVDMAQGQKALKVANSLYKERNYKEHITQQLNINYRLDHAETCQYIANLGPVVHKQGNWVLTVF